MDKKQFHELMPRDKADAQRAEYLASLGYDAAKPVVSEMVRWLRTDPSPVADVFLRFFISHGDAAAEEIEKALTTSRHAHLKYVIVTKVLPEWPRSAVEVVSSPLAMLMMDSGEPETALMALELLSKHNLSEKDWLKGWLILYHGQDGKKSRERA